MKKTLAILLLILSLLASCSVAPAMPSEADYTPPAVETVPLVPETPPIQTETGAQEITFSAEDVKPAVPYIVYNDHIPLFTEADITTEAFETYSDLDELGRCGVAYANICPELMPTEERGEIGMIRPSGWHTVRYDDIIKDKYLYNRCHLIGFQLAGENANEQNLITGTRYMNVEGMLPFENKVADYVHETGNHVLYRVTPLYRGDNLVADGVLMEAYSVEDEGAGCTFCVICPNIQPGVIIDYATGDSEADPDYMPVQDTDTLEGNGDVTYILNTRTMKFHLPECENAKTIADHNRQESTLPRKELIGRGYSPCGACQP